MKQLKISILMLLIFTIFTGIIYPVFITGIGQVFFLDKINGSLIVKNGSVIGSELLGQNFESPDFFQSRPSSVNYDSSGSGGSNLGPTNQKHFDKVRIRANQIRQDFRLSDKAQLPSDFMFASGSGLDPHISIEAAKLQAERIASARKIDVSVITDLINSSSERQLFFYGSSYVNVLKLNIALAEKGGVK